MKSLGLGPALGRQTMVHVLSHLKLDVCIPSAARAMSPAELPRMPGPVLLQHGMLAWLAEVHAIAQGID